MTWDPYAALRLSAGGAAAERERLAKVPDWKKPPVKWHRVRVLPGGRSFQYATQAGEFRHAAPGDVLTLDSETLEVRRRDVELV